MQDVSYYEMEKAVFSCQHRIFFGDCDPAGIMFYPHHFRLIDATFQAWLLSLDLSQAKLQKELNIVGTGLLDASASFRAPVRDGDILSYRLTIEDWNQKSLTVNYKAYVGDNCALEAKEVRGLFKTTDSGLILIPIKPFRNLIETRSNNGRD